GLAESYLYLPIDQSTKSGMTSALAIVARSRDGKPLDREIASVIRARHPSLVIVRSETLEQSVALGLAPQRIFTNVASALGLIGLLLASIGIYGVVAFTVARRRLEFGIRTALGAPRQRIIAMVMRHG